MMPRPIAGLVRLGVCQPGRRLLEMLEDSNSQPRERGRKPVVTPERIEMICGLASKGRKREVSVY
jgi:hypothetical protein